MSFLSEDKFACSDESSDEESDFMEYVGTVAVSDSNSDEEFASTHEPVTTEQLMCSPQSRSALVQEDDFSGDVPDACTDVSNSVWDNPQAAESSMLADSSAFDLWRSSEDSDSSDDDNHTSEPEGVTDIRTQQEGEIDSTSSDDSADDSGTSESDAAQGGSTDTNSRPQVRGRGHGRAQSRGRGRGHAQLRGRGRGRAQSRGRGRGRGRARGHNQAYIQLLPASATPISVNDSSFAEGNNFSPAREVGPQSSIEDSPTGLDLFSKYFDDTVVRQLVDATNDYAERKKTTKRLMYMRFKSSPLTPEEMWRYLGVLLLLSINLEVEDMMLTTTF